MKRKWERVYLGIGSNAGNRKKNIKNALSFLTDTPELKIRKVSSLYETEPVGGPPQGKFLNGVIACITTLSPNKLIGSLKAIEKKMGRENTKVRWGPRIIDIDILLYGSRVLKTDKLTVPHPLLHLRRFVLEPLTEIAPKIKHPLLKKTALRLLREIS